MILSEICVRRPVFASVMSLIIMLLGIIAYERLSVREYPKIEEPVVSVRTKYTGASAEIIESQITKPIEDTLAGIEGIDFIRSVSRAESSSITITFKISRDIESATSDVRDRVGRARRLLPDDADEPVISKVEADAQAIMFLGLFSDSQPALYVSDYADRFIKNRLQNIDGVSEVAIYGERKYAMRIWLDGARLAAYELTAQDVEEALRKQNVEIPAGRIESIQREFTVLSETDLKTPGEFEEIILAIQGGYPVRIKDVAKVRMEAENERQVVRFNGKSAVGLGIVKQSVANPLDVSNAVKAALPSIKENMPEGMSMEIAYDSSIFIDRSIKSVFMTIGEATLLVTVIIFLFLRNIRAVVVPLVTIPVSLLGAFVVMYALGFSINTLTLLSMVLAIGLVVDDAIVVLENIFRHIEEGIPPITAAIKGSKEIGFAVVAMTLTLAAVYIPIGFMTGRTGKLFTEFALTLAAAVIVSGFVALTVSPMMCSRMLRHEKKHSFFYNLVEDFLNRLTDGYCFLLRYVLKRRVLVVVFGLAVAGFAGFLFTVIKSELSPVEDRGTIFVRATAPEGASVAYTTKYALEMEEKFKEFPEIQRYFVSSGWPVVNVVSSFINLKDWDDRSIKQQQIVNQLFGKLQGLPGVIAFASNPPSLGQSGSSRAIEMVLQTTASYNELQKMVDAVMTTVSEKYPGMLMGLDSDLKLSKPQLRVEVDRDKVVDLGASVDVVGRTLETMLGGRQVTRFKRDAEQYDVIVQLADSDRRNPDDMTGLYVRGHGGKMTQLSHLLKVEETIAPRELNHFNQLRSATISANLGQGYAQGEALDILEETARNLLSGDVQIDYSGQSREFKSSSSDMIFMFLLAGLFIFLVLAAQFESFVDPFIIMFSVPLSIAGAMSALYLTGGSLNVYSWIGLVTLVGLITKHGILIVEFSNQLRDAGHSRLEAVIEACALRLRPILMTTGAMVLGSLPLAMASGAGAETRQQIGWVIVGGLMFGTLLTLFVVPSAYMLLAPRKRAPIADVTEEKVAENTI